MRIGQAAFFSMVVLALVPAAAATAQPAPDNALQRFISTPRSRSKLVRLCSALAPDVYQRCPGLVSKASSATVVQPVLFGPDGNPASGIWKRSLVPRASAQTRASGWRETWTISACGQFYNVPMTFITDATGIQIVAAPATQVAGQGFTRINTRPNGAGRMRNSDVQPLSHDPGPRRDRQPV
jgi:hypothetical protein